MSDEKNLGTLAKRVLFLTISCSRFGNIRKSNVELNTTANHSRFATNKKLLVSPELKQIAKRDEEVKRSVENFLLPYKVGCSILPCASAPTVRQILNDYKKVERPALVNAFKAAYTEQVAAAAIELKEEFVAADYKPVEAIAADFEFDFDMFSMDLSDEMKEQAHEKIMEAASGIAEALAVAAHELVSKLADSLSANSDGTAKKIYDKQFVKLQEFLAGFDIRNVVNSVELKAEMDKLKALMAGVDPEKVRENDGLRAGISAEMSKATASLTAMIQHQGRKFRDAEPVEGTNDNS
jgi:hypothetical protein